MPSPGSTDSAAASARDLPALPQFIQKNARGVFIDPTRFKADGSFKIFVDLFFSEGALFVDLDYDCFQKLLFMPNTFKGHKGMIKLAAEITHFSPLRKALYKGVRLLDNDARAEYMFEPAFLEMTYQEPQYGEATSDGSVPIIGFKDKTKLQSTKLNIDEFIADMWIKGIHFGILVSAVERAIAANKTDRLEVACELQPRLGCDAELQEECEGLHRDDSPMITSGKADLGRYKNRFPQISSGQRMMKKVPRVLGESGFKVSGYEIVPDVPKDMDLEAIAGSGTKVVLCSEGQFIVAVADGFISIDVDSNQISVTEKIENKSGISARTTGNLSLNVDEFIEHGEVQEGRIVDGKHMKFTSTVHGTLVSTSGRIELEGNLSGGSASSPNGSISIKNRALNANIKAIGGRIDINYAENSTIIGDDVTIVHAINCEIIASKVTMKLAQACFIAARVIKIDATDERRGVATTVSILVPDNSVSDLKIASATTAIAEFEALTKENFVELDKFKSNLELSKFFALEEMVRSGKVKMTPAQEQNFRQMQTKYASAIKALKKLTLNQQTLLKSIQAKQSEILQLKEAQTSIAQGRSCNIGEVVGETCVQKMRTNLVLVNFSQAVGQNASKMLRTVDPTPMPLFFDAHGSFEWQSTLSTEE